MALCANYFFTYLYTNLNPILIISVIYQFKNQLNVTDTNITVREKLISVLY